MSSEADMKKRIIRILRPLHAVTIRAEAKTACAPGTPDVNYVEGWIENKSVDRWPRRGETPLRVPHFTPQQRNWLRRRRRCGGNAWLLLKVENDWLLLDGKIAAEVVGHSTREQLLKFCEESWVGGLDEDSLLARLSMRP